MRIDDNIVVDDAGVTTCTHCGARLGTTPDHVLDDALVREQPSPAVGPGVRVAPEQFTDRTVVLRQAFCPTCLALLRTEIVPADEPEFRTWSVTQ